MKSKESIKEFKSLNNKQIIEKVEELKKELFDLRFKQATSCLLYTSPSPRDRSISRMPSSA